MTSPTLAQSTIFNALESHPSNLYQSKRDAVADFLQIKRKLHLCNSKYIFSISVVCYLYSFVLL